MRAVRISGAEPKPLAAPRDWDPGKDGHCSALFVRRERQGDVEFMRSAWEVDPSEIAWLYAGAQLQLGLSGNIHPVVELGVGPMPDDFETVTLCRVLRKADGTRHMRVDSLMPNSSGGVRVFSEVPLEGEFAREAAAIARALAIIDGIARQNGWVRD